MKLYGWNEHVRGVAKYNETKLKRKCFVDEEPGIA
jgi:hypothetical protein